MGSLGDAGKWLSIARAARAGDPVHCQRTFWRCEACGHPVCQECASVERVTMGGRNGLY